MARVCVQKHHSQNPLRQKPSLNWTCGCSVWKKYISLSKIFVYVSCFSSYSSSTHSLQQKKKEHLDGWRLPTRQHPQPDHPLEYIPTVQYRRLGFSLWLMHLLCSALSCTWQTQHIIHFYAPVFILWLIGGAQKHFAAPHAPNYL